jgi:Zn-dependent M16 (insulinase) family peptidase
MTHPNFECLREADIAEINTTARLYRHRVTGAQVLSMENDDENKVFGITFRTPPTDSTGIAHIMEHSVLCGSRKYPLKEPFVELIKGSLKTFLNAFTFPDKTCYPVASTNTQDFYNLIDVYLDAVFYPRLTPGVLKQEGWHYELEDTADQIVYKGVVFNEMKGAYSSPEGVLGRYTASRYCSLITAMALTPVVIRRRYRT